jgi:hypothetical protein
LTDGVFQENANTESCEKERALGNDIGESAELEIALIDKQQVAFLDHVRQVAGVMVVRHYSGGHIQEFEFAVLVVVDSLYFAARRGSRSAGAWQN